MLILLRLRKIVIFIILIFLSIEIKADDAGMRYNFASFGFNFHSPQNIQMTFVEIVNVGAHVRRLGFEFNPAKYWVWQEDDNAVSRWSFLNLTLYWNIFQLFLPSTSSISMLYFDMFTTINYIHLRNNIRWNEFVYTAGFRFGLLSPITYRLFRVEFGYQNVNRRHMLHIGLAIDIFVLIYLWMASTVENNDDWRF